MENNRLAMTTRKSVGVEKAQSFVKHFSESLMTLPAEKSLTQLAKRLIDNPQMTLGQLAKLTQSQTEVCRMLAIAVNDISNSMADEMPTEQQTRCARMLANDERIVHLTAADLRYFADKCSARAYGRPYGRLAIGDIFEWFDKFFEERCNAYCEENQRRDGERQKPTEEEFNSLGAIQKRAKEQIDKAEENRCYIESQKELAKQIIADSYF